MPQLSASLHPNINTSSILRKTSGGCRARWSNSVSVKDFWASSNEAENNFKCAGWEFFKSASHWRVVQGLGTSHSHFLLFNGDFDWMQASHASVFMSVNISCAHMLTLMCPRMLVCRRTVASRESPGEDGAEVCFCARRRASVFTRHDVV